MTRFVTIREVEHHVAAAITAGDADAIEYDVPAIAREVTAFDGAVFTLTVDVPGFWAAVERHAVHA